MDKFWQEVQTPYFWIAVVFIGLLINIVSAYLKTPIDIGLSKVSSAWKTRTERQKQAIEKLALALHDDERRAYTRWLSITYILGLLMIYVCLFGSLSLSIIQKSIPSEHARALAIMGMLMSVFAFSVIVYATRNLTRMMRALQLFEVMRRARIRQMNESPK